jgi:hypothetical protein
MRGAGSISGLRISVLATALLGAFAGPSVAATPTPPTPSPVAVRVRIAFAPALNSKALQRISLNEAAAIWREYGVELQWSDQETGPALCIDAVVEYHRRHVDPNRMPLVLGHTRLDPDPAARDAIRVSFDAVDALLEQQPFDNLSVRDISVALVLGRVLAHEIGHVLLGAPGFHDPEGLMRVRFATSELVRLERSGFRLMDASVARLRARLAIAAGHQPAESCSQGGQG